MSDQQTKNTPVAQGGVKTLEGKAISRYNAQKHAILRETITEYEKADAEQIYNDVANDLKPQGRLQEVLVESISSNIVRLIRIAKAEGESVKQALDPDELEMISLVGGYRPDMPTHAVERLEVYSRYQTATENRIFRALAFYKQLKTYEQG
ncbi:MAG TPA: hypothetical protein VJB98_01125 [Candidatus Paceibacterota bacterium]